jgi:hypothetical protein
MQQDQPHPRREARKPDHRPDIADSAAPDPINTGLWRRTLLVGVNPPALHGIDENADFPTVERRSSRSTGAKGLRFRHAGAKGMLFRGICTPPRPRVLNNKVMPLRAACGLGLAVILGGCSASEIVQNWTAPPAADLSQPNFRRIVADNIKTIFPNRQILGELEISGVRAVDHLKGPAWLTCLKLDARGNPQHYAIFIQGGKVLDWRAGIVIDECHKQTYSRLEVPPEAKKPPPATEPQEGK